MWITLLDPFARHTPFHHLWPVVFGLLEKDVLCATMTMTITLGVDLGFSFRGVKGGDLPVGRFGFFLGCFLLIFCHVAASK